MSDWIKSRCHDMSHPPPGEEILVTGISGYFPESNSVYELQENLLNKVDLISEDNRRWNMFHTDIPQGLGKIDKLEKFDASFFGVDFKLGHFSTPSSRLLLERTYEAIIDAGINPAELRNTRTGVFSGCCFNDSEVTLQYEKVHSNEHGVVGQNLASHVAQWLKVTGPTYGIDTACSSSSYALEHAFKAIRNGSCDAAIVCGSNICLRPFVSMHFYRLGILSNDGRCKPFDMSANGYARSEAIVVVLLQKAKDSRRAYAQMVYAKTNCDGYKDDGITFPARDMQKCLLKKCYDECEIPVNNVEFFEAHGTGTAVGDPEELNAVDDVMCKDRKETLFIGSIKSNLGHTEASSGLCSLAKICIAYHSGEIPPNMHFSSPHERIPALTEGRLKVVTERQAWNRGLACFSGFGYGGANAHVLLKNFVKIKANNCIPSDNLPRLVCLSGRTKAAVKFIMNSLEAKPVNVEEIRLWHAIHENSIIGHNFRGFILLGSTPKGCIRLARDVIKYQDLHNSICLVYSGVISQLVNVKELLEIPIFAATIHKCHLALKDYNIILFDIINTYPAKVSGKTLELHQHIATTAIQIGLTAIMKEIDLKPHYFIGYGIGKLGCAYADGILTEEEAIQIAYYYGLAASEETEVIDNDISGKNIARQKNVYSQSHDGSRYLKYLKTIIPNSRLCSPSWLTHSANKALKKDLVSVLAEHFNESLNDAILSKDQMELIPVNSIMLQVTPEKNLKESLMSTISNTLQINLIEENTENILQDMFVNLGRLYEAGVNLKLANIYPHVKFPVSQSTPILSHLVKWDHREDWYRYNYCHHQVKYEAFEDTVIISMDNPDQAFLFGHCIGGRHLYPGSGYLVLVWKTLAKMHACDSATFSVVFENIRFLRATTLTSKSKLIFNITLHPVSGEFEVTESNVAVATGVIYPKKNTTTIFEKFLSSNNNTDLQTIKLSQKEFYREIKLQGYEHCGDFKGVLECSIDGSYSRVIWNNDWILFIDYVLQMFLVSRDTRDLYLPTGFSKISIDMDLHYKILFENNSGTNQLTVEAFLDKHAEVARSGGLEIRGFKDAFISKKADQNVPIYKSCEFKPNQNMELMEFSDIISNNIAMVIENLQVHKFKAIEIIDEKYEISNYWPILEVVKKALEGIPNVSADLNLVVIKNNEHQKDIAIEMPLLINIEKKIPRDKSAVLVVGINLGKKEQVLEQCQTCLKEGGFIMSLEENETNLSELKRKYDIITVSNTKFGILILFREKIRDTNKVYINIYNVSNDTLEQSFSWLDELKQNLEQRNKIILYAHDSISGILGLVNCLRKEPGGDKIQCLLIIDPDAPSFDPELHFYKDQIDKNLAINVFKNGQWGCYRHLVMNNLDEIEPVTHGYLNIETIGDLSTLKWLKGGLTNDASVIADNYSFVHVYCSPLNFRDVMTATGRVSVDAVARGRLAQANVQGFEFSGKLENGMRVVGMAAHAIANVLHCHKNNLMPVPDEWTMEEASSIVVAYLTVYLAFDVLGKIRPGDSILIHAGSGGVGQAAINVALRRGCDVYTTVGTQEKKDFIKKLYPNFKDNHIGNSRDTSFEQMVMKQTNGKGVNLVLNSLADDMLLASVRCLARRGRFLEIGKYDIFNNTQIDMHFFESEISLHSVMLDYVFDNIDIEKMLFERLKNGIAIGEVRPVTSCIFEKQEIEAAYRYMASGKHMGKVIIKIREDDGEFEKPKPILLEAHKQYTCRKDYVYVLVGGLGGFGLELADWLVLKGARKLVLSSSKGISTVYQERRVRMWVSYGVDVRILTDDVTTESGCTKLLQSASAMGHVEAIFNLAGTLKDALFEQQSPETFRISFGPKGLATLFLDKLSRQICVGLRDFVVFSSLACGVGNAGQSNYALANSVMERICEERRKNGFPALAIQWGAIGDVGMVADLQAESGEMDICGTKLQRIYSCLQSLDKLLVQKNTIVTSYVLAQTKTEENDKKKTVVETVSQIIGIKNLKAISYQASLAELGMDSIMAQEIKQILERDFEIVLTAKDLRTISFTKLTTLATEQQESKKIFGNGKEADEDDSIFDVSHLLRHFDEEVAVKPFIIMNTKSTLNTANVEDLSSETLFMIPGLDGCASSLEPLCCHLNTPACVLQLPFDNETSDLQNMTNKLYKVIKPLLKPGIPYNLLGYSYGTIPLLDLAGKLENEGHTGTIFCIDGSPKWAQILFQRLDFKIPNDDTQSTFESNKPNENLNRKMTSKSEVVANRLNILKEYNFNDVKKIKSPIVLLRVENKAIKQLSENYELDKFTESDVYVHVIKGNHISILDDPNCATVIEKYMKI